MKSLAKRHTIFCFTALLFAAQFPDFIQAALVYEISPPKGYTGLHALGKACIKKNPKDWHHARNKHFILHGKDREIMRLIEREAEHAWYKLGYQLGLRPEKDPIHIVLMSDRLTWSTVIDKHSEDAAAKLAAFLGNTVFLLRDGPTEGFPTDLAHEIVHARLSAAFPELPLWLEEALALDLGIELTMAFYKTRGNRMKAHDVEGGSWHPTPHRIDQYKSTYPSDLSAFYRQCRLYIAAVKKQLTADQFRTFVTSTAQNKRSWQDVLAMECELSQEQIKELEKETILHIKKAD